MVNMTKKELLLYCTMKAVAENGLMMVSMQMVTKMANTAEGLIYKHYQTKENLLLQCYLRVYENIKVNLDDVIKTMKIDDEKQIYTFLKNLWCKYFDFFVQNKYQALFLYEYRNSSYMYKAAESGLIDPKNYFKELVEDFYYLDEHFNILHKIDLKSFFMYVTDLTIVFSIRLINNNEYPIKEDTYEMLWNLLWNGESWLIKTSTE